MDKIYVITQNILRNIPKKSNTKCCVLLLCTQTKVVMLKSTCMARRIFLKITGLCFFPNHQGLYDVLAIIEACPRPFSVVAKKEIANIQFLKQVFACMKAYMLDREDVRQAMQVIVHVTEEVKRGRNYLIFAEGTRSKNGNKVGEFKGGSFKSATKAKCPIVPVALIDSFKPFDTNTISPVTVQVHFLEPIYYEEYQTMKTTEIAAEVKCRIQKIINENIK